MKKNNGQSSMAIAKSSVDGAASKPEVHKPAMRGGYLRRKFLRTKRNQDVGSPA
jgi:hypothetical protein